jgi:hypothetical protein
MRTTLDLEEDVLMVAKDIARQRRSSVGKVISELVREALAQDQVIEYEDGFPIFPVAPNGRPVTMELVNRLRDEAP